MDVVYEDNHLIIVNKRCGEIVQGDKTGDRTLADDVKAYLKEKYAKPGNVFVGVAHRLDRPVCGLVVLAKTSKALSRLNDMFRKGEVHKTYWALTKSCPKLEEATITHWITRNERQNKSYAHDRPTREGKEATLRYRLLSRSQNYSLLEVELLTGRHHQIRCQLAHIGCPIKGDLKYGADRSNPDGGISLQSHHVEFEHPVSHQLISITAPLPDERLWREICPND